MGGECIVRKEEVAMEKKELAKRCPYVKKCGACQIGEKSYEEELADKKKWVAECIGRHCGKINDVAGMYYPYHYRNKVHAVFGRRSDQGDRKSVV